MARERMTSADLHEMAEQWLNDNMADHWSARHFDSLVELLERAAGRTSEPKRPTSRDGDDEVWVPDGEGGFVRKKIARPPG